jgi:hypothetical protein
VGVGVTLAVVGTAAVAVVVPTTAEAYCMNHPTDGPSTNRTLVCARDINGYHARYVDVCDHDADGHYAYARVNIYDGYYILTGYDTNGSASGCSTYDMATAYAGSYGLFAQGLAACVQSEGCSSWKFHDGTVWTQTQYSPIVWNPYTPPSKIN